MIHDMLPVYIITFLIYFSSIKLQILVKTTTCRTNSEICWGLPLSFYTFNNFSSFRINFTKWIKLSTVRLSIIWIHHSIWSHNLLTTWSMLHVLLFILTCIINLSINYNRWLMITLCYISWLTPCFLMSLILGSNLLLFSYLSILLYILHLVNLIVSTNCLRK